MSYKKQLREHKMRMFKILTNEQVACHYQENEASHIFFKKHK